MTKLQDWSFRLMLIGMGCAIIGGLIYEMIISGVTVESIIESFQEAWNLGLGLVIAGFFIMITGVILLIVAIEKDNKKE